MHRGDKAFNVPCLIPGCNHTGNFQTESALRKHLLKFHVNSDHKESSTETVEPHSDVIETPPFGMPSEQETSLIEETNEENDKSFKM